MMKTKCHYERPAMQVVELRQEAQLLAGSTASASVQDYNTNAYYEE